MTKYFHFDTKKVKIADQSGLTRNEVQGLAPLKLTHDEECSRSCHCRFSKRERKIAELAAQMQKNGNSISN